MKYAFIADIHEDILSLTKALNKIEKLRCDEIVCLGDISGFSVPHYVFFETRNASACLDLVKSTCKHIIAGNHDLHAGSKIPSISPLFDYPENWYEMDFPQKKKSSDGFVWLYDTDELNPLYSNSEKQTVSSFPEFEVLDGMGRNVFLSHFIYPNLSGSYSEFCSDNDDFIEHFDFMQSFGSVTGIAGHIHAQGILLVTQIEFITRKFNKKMNFPDDPFIAICPAIVNGLKQNGFLIMDFKNQIIESISI